MSLMINQNITALNAWRNLNKTDRGMSGTMEKLSSGLRINKAADDPSGLVISEQMRAQVVGLKAAIKNSEKGVSMIQTAEGALDKVHGLLDKMRGLAIDSANNATSDANMLAANQAEIDNIIATITRISDNTQYGTKKLLNGDNWSAAASLNTGLNDAGVVRVSESDLIAGTTGQVTITVNNMNTTGAARVYDGANLGGGADGVGLDWGATAGAAGVTSAATLASGNHAVITSGSLDTAAAGVAGGTNTGDLAVGAGTAYTGTYTGAMVLTATSVDDTAIATATFDVAEDGTTVGTAAYAAGAFTITYNDGRQAATLTAAATTTTGVDQDDTMSITVAASTATATLDGGPALDINRSDLTDLEVTSGTGGSAYFDFDTAGLFDGSTNTTRFQVQLAGEAMARIEDGPMVVVANDATDVTVAAASVGSLTMDLGTLVNDTTSTIDVTDNSLVFQVGANQGQTVNIGIKDVAANHMAVVANATAGTDLAGVTTADDLSEINVATSQGAQDAIVLIDAAIDEISVIRGDLGAFQANTLEANLDSLRVSAENLQASESIIRDTDMASEMAEFTKYQIMMQAGTSMLAQANQIPNNLLTLLR